MSELGSMPIPRTAWSAQYRLDKPVPLPRSTTSRGWLVCVYCASRVASPAGGWALQLSYSCAKPLKRLIVAANLSGPSPMAGLSIRAVPRREAPHAKFRLASESWVRTAHRDPAASILSGVRIELRGSDGALDVHWV